jgi:GntR family transcriptional regulator/MocR family aminotransferase
LLEAVSDQLGERARVLGASAGLHVLLQLPQLSARETPRLRAACRERGVGVYPATPFYAQPPAWAELLLGYAALGEDAIRSGVERLRVALESL